MYVLKWSTYSYYSNHNARKQSVAIGNHYAATNALVQSKHLSMRSAYLSSLQVGVNNTQVQLFPTMVPQNITWASARNRGINTRKFGILIHREKNTKYPSKYNKNAPFFLKVKRLYIVSLFFGSEGPRSRCYERSAALRLIVQPCDKDDD